MQEMKNTARATVRIGYDGHVHKSYKGHMAKERFDHEVRVLRYLEERGCTFVPRLIAAEPENLKIETTNCGTRVDRVSPEKQKELFAELETYGVRHEDQDVRNITYRVADGRFCIIDFEFATILDAGGGQPLTLKPTG
jgi:tRNA A-37 threonylcarbamoyl transferase component Bud32